MSDEIPLTPPPPPPASASDYPYPPPMASLAYSPPMRSGRPGILTAVGVISIVVAAFSGLASFYSAIMLFAMSVMARVAGMTTPVAPMPPPAPPPAVVSPANPGATTKPVIVSPRGFDSDSRDKVAQALAELQFLTAPRLAQLDELLAKSGKDMFPEKEEVLTAEGVQGMIESHVTGLSNNPAVPGPDTFRTDRGRFELYDDRAVFYPKRGGKTVRVSTLTTSPPGLTPAQIESIIQQAQAAAGPGTLNAAQIAAIRNMLAAPTQQYVSPITVPTAIRGVTPLGNGQVYVQFANGFAQIGQQGQLTSTMSGVGGAGGAAAMGGAPFGAPIKLNGAAMALAGFEILASFLLAIYLLVIGIMVLRDSPRGRKLHLIYAWLKIPLTILGGGAVWWLITGYLDAAGASAGGINTGGGMSAGIGVQAGFFFILALIYPVALLIVLQTRAVKDYYNRVAE